MNQRHGIKPCIIIQRGNLSDYRQPTTQKRMMMLLQWILCTVQFSPHLNHIHTSYNENRIPFRGLLRQPCWRQRDIETDRSNHKIHNINGNKNTRNEQKEWTNSKNDRKKMKKKNENNMMCDMRYFEFRFAYDSRTELHYVNTIKTVLTNCKKKITRNQQKNNKQKRYTYQFWIGTTTNELEFCC